MTHRQMLTAAVTKIIHTTVQLCPTSCSVLVIVVCVVIARYTVEQRVLLYESYVKCVSARKCRRRLIVNFPGSQFQTQQASVNFVVKSGLLDDFWTRNLLKKKPSVYRRKTRRNEFRLEQTPQKSLETPYTRDRHLEIVSNQSDEVVNFNLVKWYRKYLRVQGHRIEYRDIVLSTGTSY
jgi:hypothetical protein